MTENPHQSAPSTAAPLSPPPYESPEMLLHGGSGLPPLPPGTEIDSVEVVIRVRRPAA